VSSVGRAEFHCQAILFDLDGVLVQSTAGSLDQLSATRRIGHPGLASLPSMPFA
jgi:phosphoglycolate phosphatase-like HAD superfamily hydrolase